MNAYLIETAEGETAVDEYPEDYEGATVLAELDCTASYDHGLRPADETASLIGMEAAFCVMAPILCAVWRKPLDAWQWDVDHYAALQGAGIDYAGEGWADDGDTSGALYEWSDEMVNAAEDVGWIVDSSSDCGMTWFYRPMI